MEDWKRIEDLCGGVPENTEIDKLIIMLSAAGIHFETAENCGRPQVFYPSISNRVCDAICHFGSYGHEQGLIEIMGLCEESVEGSLTAKEVFKRISEHWKGEIK